MTSKTVACLAGDGVGPELMAAATRALGGVAKLHGFALDDVHLPFAGEGVMRSGHPLPAATREGYRRADAILVSSASEPALEGVKADLELTWRVARVHLGPGNDLVVAAPLGDWATEIAVDRAFASAAARRGKIVAVGQSSDWHDAIERARLRYDGLDVEEVDLAESLRRLRDSRDSFSMVVTEAQLFHAVVETAAHSAGTQAAVAHAWLSEEGPGVFAPGSLPAGDDAGFGVVDPTGMLLTVSLLLAEGLERRAPSRTLERAVGAASDGTTRGTRDFTDAVLRLLPETRTDVELFDEVWR